jgi:hypothetical protein
MDEERVVAVEEDSPRGPPAERVLHVRLRAGHEAARGRAERRRDRVLAVDLLGKAEAHPRPEVAEELELRIERKRPFGGEVVPLVVQIEPGVREGRRRRPVHHHERPAEEPADGGEREEDDPADVEDVEVRDGVGVPPHDVLVLQRLVEECGCHHRGDGERHRRGEAMGLVPLLEPHERLSSADEVERIIRHPAGGAPRVADGEDLRPEELSPPLVRDVGEGIDDVVEHVLGVAPVLDVERIALPAAELEHVVPAVDEDGERVVRGLAAVVVPLVEVRPLPLLRPRSRAAAHRDAERRHGHPARPLHPRPRRGPRFDPSLTARVLPESRPRATDL